MDFNVEINDENGRSGILDFDGREIKTPVHIPSKSDFGYLKNTVESSYYRDIDIGEYVCWLDNEQISRLSRDSSYFNQTVSRIRNQLSEIDVDIKLLHFSFFSDVKSIDANTLGLLLELQDSVGTNAIEIPNMYSDLDYRKIVEKSLEWQIGRSVDTPLIGVACNGDDLSILKSFSDQIDGIGINLSRFNLPLLYQAKEELKINDIWVHGIAAPREYSQINRTGTLGILINWFGIDSVSNNVMNWKSARHMMAKLSESTDDEIYDNAINSRYFVPNNYSTPTIGSLENEYGGTHKLSTYCDCPICREKTVDKLIEDYHNTYSNSRSHQVLSYKEESKRYQNSIRNNETEQYLNEKVYAKKMMD